MAETDEVASILERLRAGAPGAQGELFERLYGELKGIADALFRSQRPSHTLQPTALVHEAWVKMARHQGAWQDRAHFLAVAARAMRQVLVNHGRDRNAQKRGGGRARERITVVEPAAPGGEDPIDVLALDEALARLERLDERQARIAELRFFAGLTTREAAEALGIAPRTVELDWKMAKEQLAAWLRGPPSP
jgi:RNA polymerase sigma factor (TIGR02999 family)